MPRPIVARGTDAEAIVRAWATEKLDAGKNTLPTDLTLERLLTDPRLGALVASSTQLALARAADGRPVGDILTQKQMLFHFNAERLPSGRPRFVVLRTGVRCGKSLIAAMALLLSVLTCTFRRPPEPHETPSADGLVGVRPGERVRAVIIAPRIELARAVFAHLTGTMLASPVLCRMIPPKPGAESVTITRSDGAKVEVLCLAAASGGTNIRSTWLAGVVFDEGDFFDDDEAAVNLKQQVDAAGPRLLPGAQAWIPSSPWSEEGPFAAMHAESFGKGNGDSLSFHSDSRSMNPTLSVAAEAADRAKDPDSASREYDAIPLAANAPQFFPALAIARALEINPDRPLLLPPKPGYQHEAASDLGFTKNSSALAIARGVDGVAELAYYEERRPPAGHPLKPSEVCGDFGKTCVGYGALSLRADHHYKESAREHLEKEGVDFEEWNPTTEATAEAFTLVRTRMAEGHASLPNDPRLLQQMRDVRSQPIPGGGTRIILPKRGRAHGDVLMAAVLALAKVRFEEVDTRLYGRVKSRRQ